MEKTTSFYDKCMVADYNTSFEYFVDYFDEAAVVKTVIEYGKNFLVMSESTPEYGDGLQLTLLISSNDFEEANDRAFHVTSANFDSEHLDDVKDIFSVLCMIDLKRYGNNMPEYFSVFR